MKLVAIGLVLAACGSGSSKGGSADAGPSTMGGVTLVVNHGNSPQAVGSQRPPAGASYIQLDVTLANVDSPAAISTSFALFSLETEQAVVFMADAESIALPQPCGSSTSLTMGGHMTCGVVFAMTSGQTPKLAHYNDEQGHAASATVPAIQVSTSCGQPGDLGNELGVGKYCTTISDCSSSTAPICATLGDPMDTYCTTTCSATGPATQCGSGATCACNGSQCACKPSGCM